MARLYDRAPGRAAALTVESPASVFSEAVSVLNIRPGPKVASSSRRMVLDAEGPAGELLAVKVTLSAPDIDLTRFAAEYLVGSGMSHPNLLRTTGCGVAGGMPFLLMEHMPSTVEKLIANGSIEEEQAIQIVLQAARGVAALHEMSLTHGDLKPSNFLYDPETGLVKVCDFGSVTGANALIGSSAGRGRTITPAFASPEQLLNGDAPGPASDVYALGMVLLQLLSGRHPLAGLPVGEVVKMHARGMRWAPGNLPARVKAVIAGCLEREPQNRYRSAGELARALEQIAPREERPDVPPGSDQMQTLEANGPLVLIPTITHRRPELAAATLALSSSVRDALSARHGQRRNQCAVIFHMADVKKDPADPDIWVTTVAESHTGSGCRSGPRQASVDLKDPLKVEGAWSGGGDSSGNYMRLSDAPSKTAAAGLVAAVLLAVGAAVTVATVWLAVGGSRDGEAMDAGNSASELYTVESLQVPAGGGWFDSGVDVAAAQALVIEASGRAYFAGCCSSTPDGTDSTRVFPAGVDFKPGDTWVAPELPAYSLVGRIGDGSPFFIGSRTRFSTSNSGRLYLAMNDTEDTLHDNQGSWSVTVSTDQLTAGVPMIVPPQLFLHQDEEPGKLLASGLAAQPDTRGYALFDLATETRVDLVDANNPEFELPPGSPGETKCYFARVLTTAGYGMATRSACATLNSQDTLLQINEVVQLPGEGESYAVAVTPDGHAVYTARGQAIFKLSAANLEIQRSARLPGDTRANIVDMAVEPGTGRVVYVSSGPGRSYVGILDSELNPVEVIEDPEIDFDRVVISEQVPGMIYAIGGRGWLIIDSATLETKSRVNLQRSASANGAVSPDGKYIFGQQGDSVSEDTVYAFDPATGQEQGSFTFGDAGGGVHYTAASDAERLLLFAGDGSVAQNTYVLSVPGLQLVQELNVPGLSWAAESQDGTYLLAVQNRAHSGTMPDTGLALVMLQKDSGDHWTASTELELVAGNGVSGAHIATSPSLDKFFIPSPATGQLFAVSNR